MRIATGLLKGLEIKPIKGIRPTQDKVKNSVFNILGNDMAGVRFLELYAGSGLVGFEALSRNAQEVIFVEKNPFCAGAINSTLERVKSKLEDKTVEVLRQDAIGAIEKLYAAGQKFDVIFCDPPYYQIKLAELVESQQFGAKKPLQTLSRYDIMTDTGVLVIQASRKEILEETYGSLRLLRSYVYGDTVLLVYNKAA